MTQIVFTPVFRRKAQGDKKPRVGLPDSIRPGDYLTVYINGACHTRRCLYAHKGHVLTEPLRWNGQTLDSSRKIPWEDIEEASRPPEGFQEPVTDTLVRQPPPPLKKPEQPKTPEPSEVLVPEPVPDPPKRSEVPEPPKKPAAPEPPKKPRVPKKPAAPEPSKKPMAQEPPNPEPKLPSDLTDLWSLLSNE